MNARDKRIVGDLFHALTLAQNPHTAYERISECLLRLSGACAGHFIPVKRLWTSTKMPGVRVSLRSEFTSTEHDELEKIYERMLNKDKYLDMMKAYVTNTNCIVDVFNSSFCAFYHGDVLEKEWQKGQQLRHGLGLVFKTRNLHLMGMSSRTKRGYKKSETSLLQFLVPYLVNGLNNLDEWESKFRVFEDAVEYSRDAVCAIQDNKVVMANAAARSILNLTGHARTGNPYVAELCTAIKVAANPPHEPLYLTGADGRRYLLGLQLSRALSQPDAWMVRFEPLAVTPQTYEQLLKQARTLNLTSRQSEILAWLSTGLSNKEIAHRMGISYYTVRAHLRLIFEKLNVDNRSAARDMVLFKTQ